MEDRVTEERIDRYLGITRRALDKLSIAAPDRSFAKRLADDFLTMATSYYEDARHFRESGDLVIAFAAVNYAHGWLDCGARIGLWDVGGDDTLFTLYERSPDPPPARGTRSRAPPGPARRRPPRRTLW